MRPQKRTVDYFPHDCNPGGKTIFTLEQRYGATGYAFWFKLLELLGRSDGHVYDCDNPAEWEFLCARTFCDGETADNILGLLARLGAIDTDLWSRGRLIWCQNFVDRLSTLYQRRKSETPKKPVIADRNPPQEELLHTETPLDEVTVRGNPSKKSKVKERKEKKRKDLRHGSTELAGLLAEKIQENFPDNLSLREDRKERTLANWAEDIDRMLRLDKRSPEEVRRVIVWAQLNSFWRSNILSAATLREKYDRLVARMSESGQKKPGPTVNMHGQPLKVIE